MRKSAKLKTPIISVVVTSYNTSQFIEEALDSVINQKIGFKNIQMIIVDDKSTDNSWEIIQRYAKKYPDNILAVQNAKNSGVNFSRNKGFSNAKGKYLMFFDGDDVLSLDALKKLTSACEKNGTQMAVGAWQMFNQDGVLPLTHHGKQFMADKPNVTTDTFPTMIYESNVANKIFSFAWLKKLNIKFYETLNSGADGLFIQEVITNNPHTSYISDIVYHYRRWGVNDTLSARIDKPVLLSLLCAINKLFFTIYKQHKVDKKLIDLLCVGKIKYLIENKIGLFLKSGNLEDIEVILMETQKFLLKLERSAYETVPYELQLKIILIKLGEFRWLLNLIDIGISIKLIAYLEQNYKYDLDAVYFLKEYYKHLLEQAKKGITAAPIKSTNAVASSPNINYKQSKKKSYKLFFRKVKIITASLLRPIYKIMRRNLILIGEASGAHASGLGYQIFQHLIASHKNLNIKFVISKTSQDLNKIPKKYRIYHGSLKNFIFAKLAKIAMFANGKNDIITKADEFLNDKKQVMLFLKGVIKPNSCESVGKIIFNAHINALPKEKKATLGGVKVKSCNEALKLIGYYDKNN